MRKAGLLDRKPMSATAAMMHKAKSDKGVIKTAAHIYGITVTTIQNMKAVSILGQR